MSGGGGGAAARAGRGARQPAPGGDQEEAVTEEWQAVTGGQIQKPFVTSYR